MARANDGNLQLSELTALVDMMRAKGVIKITTGGTEILMGPPLAPNVKEVDKDARAPKRAHYMNLLGRASISDTELDLLPDGV